MNSIRKTLGIALLFTLLLFFSSVFILFSGIVSAGPLPDTGQTQSYTNNFGEDSDYIINPQSYTKLDDQGNDLPNTAPSWAMVRDNITGLIWEVKTDNGTIHDRDRKYKWHHAQDVFIQALNEASFGGFSDWRIPTIKELMLIVNRGRYNPAINTAYFPNTQSSGYWSSTTEVGSPDDAWEVHFYHGNVNGDDKFFFSYFVRAVRGGQ